ncbi:hypothetical protein EUGRSUZ_H01371 [Eucalyptus grandis]|uniref:Uncharacterized protein n=2 Tax=Eucalyptus grandis TaxID=71139 RepID=A0A059AZ57_EUCGR|nr:hypothetical protein EUGRSUZ_H01371 [Eucalyptus grandis]
MADRRIYRCLCICFCAVNLESIRFFYVFLLAGKIQALDYLSIHPTTTSTQRLSVQSYLNHSFTDGGQTEVKWNRTIRGDFQCHAERGS